MAAQRTYAEVVAGVGASIAAYTHALDDGRTDDLVATFCPDGVCDMPGLGRHEGREALRQAYSRLAPDQAQRHLVLNTEVTAWTDDEVHATSDVVFLHRADQGWTVRLVGRYRDVLHRDGETWRFHRRMAEFTA
jgi:hypothetical protein